MADLSRDFWIRETGTGQQVAQIHDRYMMMMMMMMMMMAAVLGDSLLVLTTLVAFCKSSSCQLPLRFFLLYFPNV